MKTIKGDLIKLALENKFDIIIHGCNCFCTMNAGIAKQIRFAFPLAYKIDCLTKKGDLSKLGNYSIAEYPNIKIINAYTQYHYNRYKTCVDYNAIKTIFNKIKLHFSGYRIAYPKIGAGLAGGDWNKISTIIENALINEDHTLVVYK